MKAEQKSVLELARIGATEECLFSQVLYESDFNTIMKIAFSQGIACLGMRAMQILYSREIKHFPQDVVLSWIARSELAIKSLQKNFEISKEFAEKLKPLKIVALKGIDYARYWPNPAWREFGDLDCYAADGNTAEIDKRAKEIGADVKVDNYKHSHNHYKGLSVENHHFFTPFAGSGAGEILEKELQELFRGEFKKIGDSELLSPNSNFTAVFMIAHAQSHFFIEGITLRMILDWQFFLTKEGGTVDLERVKGVLKRTRLKAFADLLTVFCENYCGLKKGIYVVENRPDNELLNDFVDDVFSDKIKKDLRWYKMMTRILNRFRRMIKFRKLMIMPFFTAVWRTVAFNSYLDRKPKLN